MAGGPSAFWLRLLMVCAFCGLGVLQLHFFAKAPFGDTSKSTIRATAACMRKISTVYGYDINVHCKKNDKYVSMSIEENTWPVRRVTGVLKSAIKYLKGGNDGRKLTSLDIGANIGMYTQYMATRGFRVISFEPLPENIDIFEANVRMNSKSYGKSDVHLIKAALSTENGKVKISVTPESPGATSLATDLSAVPWEMKHSQITVELTRGDAVLRHLGIKSAEIIKIDVEGHELGALKGLGSLQSLGVKIIAAEYFPEMLKANGMARPQELFTYILNQGFWIWSQKEGAHPVFLRKKEDIDPFISLHKDRGGHFDIFAISATTRDRPFYIPVKSGVDACVNCAY